jgi:hypothetical protein
MTNNTDIIININDFKFTVIKEKIINSSSYFKNMLCSDFKESNNNNIILYDININNIEIFNFFFNFLQLDLLDNNINIFNQLFNCKYIDEIYYLFDYFCLKI